MLYLTISNILDGVVCEQIRNVPMEIKKVCFILFPILILIWMTKIIQINKFYIIVHVLFYWIKVLGVMLDCTVSVVYIDLKYFCRVIRRILLIATTLIFTYFTNIHYCRFDLHEQLTSLEYIQKILFVLWWSFTLNDLFYLVIFKYGLPLVCK